MRTPKMAYTRRDVLVGLAGLGGASLLVPIPRIASGDPSLTDEQRHLGPEQRACLAAAVERLLPGALEAGVPAYMDHWLAHRSFRLVGRYLAFGARRLDEFARKRHGSRSFAACTGEEQDAMLEACAAGEFKAARFDGGLFFRQLMELTLEGYLSDPRYGGNRDRVGWRFIGVPDGLRSCWWNPRGVERILSPDEGFCD